MLCYAMLSCAVLCIFIGVSVVSMLCSLRLSSGSIFRGKENPSGNF